MHIFVSLLGQKASAELSVVEERCAVLHVSKADVCAPSRASQHTCRRQQLDRVTQGCRLANLPQPCQAVFTEADALHLAGAGEQLASTEGPVMGALVRAIQHTLMRRMHLECSAEGGWAPT